MTKIILYRYNAKGLGEIEKFDEMTKIMTIPFFFNDENEMSAVSSLSKAMLRIVIDAGRKTLVLLLK